jgi:hypothetical protein
MRNPLRRALYAAVPACALLAPAAGHANVIQLGFVLDRSGSIGAGNWTTIVNGLAGAVNLIPTTGRYEVSVVTFSSNATTDVARLLVDSVAARTALSTAIAGLPFTGGGTDYADAFDAISAAFAGSTATVDASYVNFATDGEPGNPTAAVTARDALIAAGVDNISIEAIAIGASGAAFLQNAICFPGPCDATAPFNFPAQGFYLAVPDAAAYAAAIATKVRVVTQQPIPVPGAVALFGAGLLGLGLVRARRAAA